jgi:hypothetical protein
MLIGGGFVLAYLLRTPEQIWYWNLDWIALSPLVLIGVSFYFCWDFPPPPRAELVDRLSQLRPPLEALARRCVAVDHVAALRLQCAELDAAPPPPPVPPPPPACARAPVDQRVRQKTAGKMQRMGSSSSRCCSGNPKRHAQRAVPVRLAVLTRCDARGNCRASPGARRSQICDDSTERAPAPSYPSDSAGEDRQAAEPDRRAGREA